VYTTVTVEIGDRYVFCYATPNGKWFNDESVDDCRSDHNERMSSILDLTCSSAVGAAGPANSC
jgi:hypothetical protein